MDSDLSILKSNKPAVNSYDLLYEREIWQIL